MGSNRPTHTCCAGVITIGVDEAGRGALAGPVVAAAVSLSEAGLQLPLMDSKKLSAVDRDALFEALHRSGSRIHAACLSARYIDKTNILKATLVAMKRAVDGLHLRTEPFLEILVDGNKVPPLGYGHVQAIVKGDTLIPAISAASIIAKVTRDRIMMALHPKFPRYRFDQHKGYGTAEHYDAIFAYGPCNSHRLSFNLTRQESLF
ncbi:MAG: ribonuclease HII [Candidatus Margulisiibacteriota bacterium]